MKKIIDFDPNYEIDNSLSQKTICVLCYNRPQYLVQLVKSLEDNDINADYHFFQDGNICFISGDETTEKEKIEDNIKIIMDSSLINVTIHLSKLNYSIAIMYREAKRIIFENSNIDFALFIEDDCVLSPYYFDIIWILKKQFDMNSKVYSVQAYDFCIKDLKEKIELNNYVYPTFASSLGIGIWRDKWLIIKNDFDKYYYIEAVKEKYESKRLLEHVEYLYKTFMDGILVFSQDAVNQFCIMKNELFRIGTKINHLNHIGEYGVHTNSKNYKIYQYHLVNLDIFKPKEKYEYLDGPKKICEFHEYVDTHIGIEKKVQRYLDDFFIINKMYRNNLKCLNVGYGIGVSNNVIKKYMECFSIEHDEKYMNIDAGFSPLVECYDDFEKYMWYNIEHIPKKQFDMVFIDGPEGSIGRYGVIPELLKSNMINNNTLFILDDFHRNHEKDIVQKWIKRYGLNKYSPKECDKLCFLFYGENRFQFNFGKKVGNIRQHSLNSKICLSGIDSDNYKLKKKIMLETDKFRKYILDFIDSYFSLPVQSLDIIDIGCGPSPLNSLCDTFETANPYSGKPIREITFIGDAEFADEIVDKKYDVVYSSHLLEDFEEEKTIPILKKWSSLLKNKESLLILLLPNQKKYREYCESHNAIPNPGHKMEDFNLDYISDCCEKTGLYKLFSLEFFNGDTEMSDPYNFIYICSKSKQFNIMQSKKRRLIIGEDKNINYEDFIKLMLDQIRNSKLLDSREDNLKFCIDNAFVDGNFFEFGVASGYSLNLIARNTNKMVFGFDSFYGLPGNWEGFKIGYFSTNGKPPEILEENVSIVKGYFDRTVSKFFQENNEKISFMHIDCDIYTAAKEVLNGSIASIVPGTVICFDELYNYPTFEQHEMKALFEIMKCFNVKFEVISHCPIYHVGIKIIDTFFN